MAEAPRDYKKEYRDHQSSPKDKADRAKRNHDRAEKEKELGHELGTNQVVHHVDGDLNGPTRVMSRRGNAGVAEKSRLKGSARNNAVVKELRSRRS